MGFKKGHKPWNWKLKGDKRTARFGADHWRWKGGIKKNKKGYKDILIGEGKYRQEHRVVMEKFLKRKLTSEEIVHHKDENPANNSIENLELMSRSEHGKLHRLKKPTGFCAKPRVSSWNKGKKMPEWIRDKMKEGWRKKGHWRKRV